MNVGRCVMGLAALLCAGIAWAADPGKLTVRVDQPGVKISPMFYGLMTEEINYSYDGGLYAELIRNRIFKDDPRRPAHWSVVKAGDGAGAIELDTADPVNTAALTTSLRVDIATAGQNSRVGVANDGYWGIPVKPDTTYRASFYAKAKAGFASPLTVTLESEDGMVTHANATVASLSMDWQKYTVSLKISSQVQASTRNRFVISATTPGTIWLSLVSLFPPTFNDRPNGNRIDLMEKMAGLKPTYLRFPGGNYLEGNTIAERFDWKKTLGPLEERPGHMGPWSYRSTDGMGLLEFLWWCDDLKLEPVLAVYAGYSLQGERVLPGKDLEPYVQDALDEIEYVTGDANTTKWGAERAKGGHPEPFKLRYVEIGNEDNFDRSGSYEGRFAQFYDAIKAKYPQLQLIATTPVRSRTPDVLDDHFYRSSRGMQQDVRHYDRTNRNGPKIFVGEWAVTEGSPTSTMNAALGDAAWLTGMERNSDLIIMQCYAPLLTNINRGASQWPTNLIGYDALDSFVSPSYLAQKMFADHRGDTVLPVEIVAQNIPKPEEQPLPHGAVGVGSWATKVEYKDLKVTQGETVLFQPDLSKGIESWKVGNGDWSIQDGTIRQNSIETNCRAVIGDPSWKDYTLSVKARKLSGAEGFLILFHVADDNTWLWWNVGGWTNTQTGLERAERGAKEGLGRNVNMTLESDRWYDLRIEVTGRQIRCYMDDKLITEATNAPVSFAGNMFASATREDATGDILLKVVNSLPTAQQIEIDLQGIATVGKEGSLEVLTSADPGDMNSLQAKEKVATVRSALNLPGVKFAHEFKPNSVSAIRIRTR